MDNFKIIYKILKILEKYMDYESVPVELITHEAFDISKERWSRILKMMIDSGLIEGVRCIEADGAAVPIVKLYNPSITLKGLEYLEENSIKIIRTPVIVMGVLFIDNQSGGDPDISRLRVTEHAKHPRGCYFSTLFYWLQRIKNNDKSHTERVGI